MEEEWRQEGGEGGRGEYYRKTAGLREIISSTGAVAKELKVIVQGSLLFERRHETNLKKSETLILTLRMFICT